MAQSYSALVSLRHRVITHKIFRTFYRSLSRESTHDTYFYALNGERKEKCSGIKNRLMK